MSRLKDWVAKKNTISNPVWSFFGDFVVSGYRMKHSLNERKLLHWSTILDLIVCTAKEWSQFFNLFQSIWFYVEEVNASIFVQILLANYHKEYKKISMGNVSLLAEDSHGKKKMGERREISAGLRRVLSFSRRPYLWSKPTGPVIWAECGQC